MEGRGKNNANSLGGILMKILLKSQKVAGERAAIFDREFSGKKLMKYQINLVCVEYFLKILFQAPTDLKFR